MYATAFSGRIVVKNIITWPAWYILVHPPQFSSEVVTSPDDIFSKSRVCLKWEWLKLTWCWGPCWGLLPARLPLSAQARPSSSKLPPSVQGPGGGAEDWGYSCQTSTCQEGGAEEENNLKTEYFWLLWFKNTVLPSNFLYLACQGGLLELSHGCKQPDI